MSDTPQTDEKVIRTVNVFWTDASGAKKSAYELVEASFARSLERENTALRAEVDLQRSELNMAFDQRDKAWKDLSDLRHARRLEIAYRQAIGALEELVRLKDIKERIEGHQSHDVTYGEAQVLTQLIDEYTACKEAAWQAGRAALAQATKLQEGR